jgi:hypothetical protein
MPSLSCCSGALFNVSSMLCGWFDKHAVRRTKGNKLRSRQTRQRAKRSERGRSKQGVCDAPCVASPLPHLLPRPTRGSCCLPPVPVPAPCPFLHNHFRIPPDKANAPNGQGLGVGYAAKGNGHVVSATRTHALSPCSGSSGALCGRQCTKGGGDAEESFSRLLLLLLLLCTLN